MEAFAVAGALLYTLLITYQIIWCWAFAIVSSSLLAYLCYKKQIFADAGLQVFYVLTAIYGWISWGGAADINISQLRLEYHFFLMLSGAMTTAIFSFLLRRFTTSVYPPLDALIAVFSVIATFLMIGMVLENWIYWMVIDVLAVVLYAMRRLYFGALLHVGYFILSVNGYLEWQG